MNMPSLFPLKEFLTLSSYTPHMGIILRNWAPPLTFLYTCIKDNLGLFALHLEKHLVCAQLKGLFFNLC